MGRCSTRFVDRLTILAGAVVCWHFELLPRWALALLAAREVAMLFLAQYGLRHGVEIEVNWPGPDLRLPDHGRDLLRAGLRRLGARRRC